MALPTFSEAAALPERTLLSMAVSRKKPNGDSIDVVEKKKFFHARHTNILNVYTASGGIAGRTALLGLIVNITANATYWVHAHNAAVTPTDETTLQFSYSVTGLGAAAPGQLFLDEKWFGEGGETFTNGLVIYVSTDQDDPTAPGDITTLSISVNAVSEPAA